MSVTVLATLLVLASGTDERALTTWLAEAAAAVPGTEVVTTADVQQLLAMQGEKQASGCTDESEACQAELAAALGAELVVRAELSTLDGARTLAVAVVNTKNLGSTRRALWQASSTSALGERARADLPALLAAARQGTGSVKVFVVDVVDGGNAGVAPAAAADASGPGWMLPVGGVVAGVGVVGVGVAAVAEVVVLGLNDQLALGGEKRLDQPAAAAAESSRAGWALAGQVGWIVGAAGVVAGGAVLALGMVE